MPSSPGSHGCLHCTFEPAYLPVVTQLVAILLALVGSDQQMESMLAQQFLRDIGSKVAAPSSKGVGTAAVMRFGVAPQDVDDLRQRGKRGGCLNASTATR